MKLHSSKLQTTVLEGFTPANWIDGASEETRAIQAKALRNSWTTRKPTLALASSIIGLFDTDPFYNPWSHVHEFMVDGDVTVYTGDGTPEDDGLTRGIDELGNSIFANGPFSYVKVWARHYANVGKSRNVAMVCPGGADTNWWSHVWTADLVIFLQRTKYDPPPDIKESSPSKPTALAIWKPIGDPIDRTPRMIQAPGFKCPLFAVPGPLAPKRLVTSDEMHDLAYGLTLGGLQRWLDQNGWRR